MLEELGALRKRGGRDHPRLSAVGRKLAALPVDPRMGRMLLAAERQGCLREMLIIVSGLSIQDPRERPAEHREKADQLHRRFWAPLGDTEEGPPTSSGRMAQTAPPADGDFMALLRLWTYVRDAQHRLSGNAFRRLCRDEFLHFLRIREWQDLHTQLRDISKDLGLNRNHEPAAAERIHTAALAGLLSHVGLADLREDQPAPGTRRLSGGGARRCGSTSAPAGTRFAINPGSSLARVQPPLVVAAEIVETTRLWARTVAEVKAEQVEEVGAHLLKRTYSEPHWSSRAGSVLAYEQVTLYGIPIVAGRRVGYAGINPAEARDIFIRSALVEGSWRTRHRFFARNAEVRAEAEELEEKARRRDLTVDDEVIFDFYAARIPAEVTGAVQFDNWWKTARQETPELLDLGLDDLVVGAITGEDAFPTSWVVDGARARGQLRLRSRLGRGRRHRRDSARPAQPDRRRTVQLAGAGAAPRARHRADQDAAEERPSPAGPGGRVRRSGAGLARPAPGGRIWTEESLPARAEPGDPGPHRAAGRRLATGRRAAPPAGAVRDHRWRRYDRGPGPGSDSAEGGPRGAGPRQPDPGRRRAGPKRARRPGCSASYRTRSS